MTGSGKQRWPRLIGRPGWLDPAAARAARWCLYALAAVLGALAPMLCAAAGWADVYVQLGHSNMVLSVALSPDGRTLASGGADCSIKLWDLASGHELRALSEEGAAARHLLGGRAGRCVGADGPR